MKPRRPKKASELSWAGGAGSRGGPGFWRPYFFCGLVAQLVTNFFNDYLWERYIWVCFAFAAALALPFRHGSNDLTHPGSYGFRSPCRLAPGQRRG